MCIHFRAFAVTETIESAYALTPNGTLMDLSEQEMMDCSAGYGGSLHGCSGGDTCTALSWMLTVRLFFREIFFQLSTDSGA